MADQNIKKVQEYKNLQKAKAEELILKGFPENVVKLNKILEDPKFFMVNVHQEIDISNSLSSSNSDMPSSKVIKCDNNITVSQDGNKNLHYTQTVISNKHVLDIIEIVKPHVRQLVEEANQLQIWISLLIPKIEDGNNFGVDIQEGILDEIRAVESEAATFFDQMSQYFVARGRLLSKVVKYPNILDYRNAVHETDDKMYFSLRRVMIEIRNHYCTLNDAVVKNLDKIRKPRSRNSIESLY